MRSELGCFRVPWRILAVALIFLSALMATIFLVTFAILMAARDVLFCNSQRGFPPKISSRKYKNVEITSLNVANDEELYDFNEVSDIINDEIEFEEQKKDFLGLNSIPLLKSLSLHVVSEKRNYSDAAEYCASKQINGKLLTTSNEMEENFIMEYLNQNQSAFEVCDRLFIGYRHTMDKLFLSPDGILFYPSNEISSQVSDFYLYHNKQCGKLSLKDTHRVESTPCNAESTCFVCDVLDENCGGKSLCQRFVNVLWPPISFSAANKHCKETFSNSAGLALFPYDQIPPVFRKTISHMSSQQLSANSECLVLRTNLSKLYETFDGVSMAYHSRRIQVDNYKDHCLAIDKNRHYKWISESCSNLNCFVCRINVCKLITVKLRIVAGSLHWPLLI